MVVYDSAFGNTAKIALAVPPEGPLLEGELERAAGWARQIAATLELSGQRRDSAPIAFLF
ncbi:MAG: hypothetical protein ACOYZ7_06180 [Chloroflexota bacterium]